MCSRFTNDEFCNICACYIKEKYRKPITERIQDMYLEIYDLDMNLEYYAPTSVCEDCEISLSMYVLGEIDFLKIKSPARWGECRGDHRNCFYHLVKVNYRTNKTHWPAKSKASYFPPKFSPKMDKSTN